MPKIHKLDLIALISYNLFILLNAIITLKFYTAWHEHMTWGFVNYSHCDEQISYMFLFGGVTILLILVELYLFTRRTIDKGDIETCHE